MSAKKRQKVSRRNLTENKSLEECVDLSNSENSGLVTHNICENDDSFYLSHLPSEVLLCIYTFLSPVDLLTMAELGNQRLSDLTFYIKHANFSSCKADPQRISAYFSRTRVKHIKQLNFNYTIYLKPRILTQFICKCKNLTVLSIVECGIKFQNLAQILQTCCQIEELAWNVDEVVQMLTVVCPNMKTVYLYCDIKEVPLKSIYLIVRNFPYVKDVWINFSSDLISTLPYVGVWLKVSSVSNQTQTKRYTYISNSFQCISHGSDVEYLRKIIDRGLDQSPFMFDQNLINLNEPYFQKDTTEYRTFKFPPYVQIESSVEDVELLSTGPCNSFSTLSVVLTAEILDVSESLAESVLKTAGAKLRHLSLQSEAYHFSEDGLHPMPISSEESLIVCDVLEKIASTSKYITVLNLVTVHFTIGSPFKAICKLKFLKTLNIPSCAFFKSFSKVIDRSLLGDELFEFKDVVSSCVLVENFSLVCCPDDYMRFADLDLYPLQDWPELRCLTIYSMIFRTCFFLRRVADSCKKFQSLSLVSIAPKNICIFTTDVIYVLKNAKSLTFIRINEERFNPMYERFWDAIGEASNLEGICIITLSKVAIEKQVVVRAIKKLKYLHNFHFFASRASERLYVEVKKSMQDYGVVNYRMEKLCYINSSNKSAKLQYYHLQPHFCCQHIHFRDYY